MEVTKTWERGFDAAKAAMEHASASTPSKRMGAAVYQKGKLIAIGFNHRKTHPDYNRVTNSIHAEHAALIKARNLARGGTIYVYRQLQDGTPGCSKPCEHCMQLLRQAGIKKIRYISEDGLVMETKMDRNLPS